MNRAFEAYARKASYFDHLCPNDYFQVYIGESDAVAFDEIASSEEAYASTFFLGFLCRWCPPVLLDCSQRSLPRPPVRTCISCRRPRSARRLRRFRSGNPACLFRTRRDAADEFAAKDLEEALKHRDVSSAFRGVP